VITALLISLATGFEATPPPTTGFNDAYKYFVDMRSFPDDKVDWHAYQAAIDHREQMPRVELPITEGPSPANVVQWQYVGPRDLDIPYQQYFGFRPLSGRVNGAWVRPNGETYLATPQGGIWKSPGAAAGPWYPLSDQWEALHTSCVAYDESTGWLYAGTGDFHGYTGAGFGIMASPDGGLNWVEPGRAGFGGTAVSALLIDPLQPGAVLASTGRGANGMGYVWRSLDFGNTWTRVINVAARWSDLEGGQGQPMYAAGGKNNGEVWRSTNFGATWTKLNPPISAGDHPVLDLAVGPTTGNVYLLVPKDRKIYRSTNTGTTWTDITGAFIHGPANYNWSQSSYDFYIEASEDPAMPGNDLVFVGLIDLVCGRQAHGYAWHSLGGPTYDPASNLHNDQHCLTPIPWNASEFLIGNDGGIYRMTYDPSMGQALFDGSRNADLGITQCYKLGMNPYNSEVMLAGTQDNATPFSDSSVFLPWRNVGGGDGGFCEINVQNSSTMMATSQFLGIYLSVDSFASWQDVTPNTAGETTAFIAPAIFERQAPFTSSLYGASNYLHWYSWDSNLGQYRWYNRRGNQPLSSSSYVTAMASSPLGVGGVATGSRDGEVWRSNDHGSTWMRVDDLGSPTLPDRAVTDMTYYMALGLTGSYSIGLSGTGTGHVFLGMENTWGGGPPIYWEDKSGVGTGRLPDVSINAIELGYTGFWLAAGDVGIFHSSDDGQTWKNITQPLGLPNVQINDLAISHNHQFLYVATYGRGIWRLPLNIQQPVDSIIANPNPAATPCSYTLTGYLAGPAPFPGTTMRFFNGATQFASTYVSPLDTSGSLTGQFLGAGSNTTIQFGAQSDIGPIVYTNLQVLRASHMNATVQLEGYVGPRPVTVTYGFRNEVGYPYNRFYAPSVASGSHNVSIPIDYRQMLNFYVQAPGYLKKAVAVDCTNRPTDFSIGTLVLTCGDIDSDNEISIGDYALLSTAFNSSMGDPNWNPMADINNDETVDIGDYALFSMNYGEIGDD